MMDYWTAMNDVLGNPDADPISMLAALPAIAQHNADGWLEHDQAQAALAMLDQAALIERAAALRFVDRPDLFDQALAEAHAQKDRTVLEWLAASCVRFTDERFDTLFAVNTAPVRAALARRDDLTIPQQQRLAADRRQRIRHAIVTRATDPSVLLAALDKALSLQDVTTVSAYITQGAWLARDPHGHVLYSQTETSHNLPLERLAAYAIVHVDERGFYASPHQFVGRCSADGLRAIVEIARSAGRALDEDVYTAILGHPWVPTDVVDQLSVLPGQPEIRKQAREHAAISSRARAASEALDGDSFSVTLSRATWERLMPHCTDDERGQIAATLGADMSASLLVAPDGEPGVLDTLLLD